MDSLKSQQRNIGCSLLQKLKFEELNKMLNPWLKCISISLEWIQKMNINCKKNLTEKSSSPCKHELYHCIYGLSSRKILFQQCEHIILANEMNYKTCISHMQGLLEMAVKLNQRYVLTVNSGGLKEFG